MMTTPCDAVLDALAAQEAFSPQLREHARVCPPCHALVTADAQLMPVAAPLKMPAALQAEVAQGAGVKPFAAGRKVAAVAGAMGLVALGAATLHPLRPDASSMDPKVFWGLGVAWVLLAAAALWAFLARAKSGVGHSNALRLGVLVAAGVAFEVFSFWGVDLHAGKGDEWWKFNLACPVYGLVYALPMGAVLWWISRRSAPVAPRVAGSLAGLGAAYMGVWVLHLHCGLGEPWHVLVSHGMVLVLGVAVGAWTAPRWLVP